MRFRSLAQWLEWQETLHPLEMDLGLERMGRVVEQLGWGAPPFAVLSVAGTNGKGSTVAYLEAMLRAEGLRTGAFTSPHVLRYNERIRVDAREVDDARLVTSFARLDEARRDTTLTYFEFATLAAVDIFRDEGLDVVILEVGIGGRLDAVNLFDADVAVVTPIDIDHVQWLGSDRDSIGREKAGIFRPGRPVVISDPHPPDSLEACARALHCPMHRLGREYVVEVEGERWHWHGPSHDILDLPLPRLHGRFQIENAAGAIAARQALGGRDRSLPAIARDAVVAGLGEALPRARFERLPGPPPERIVDIAHNPHAARFLARSLAERPSRGRTLAVVAMLEDKDHAAVLRELAAEVDQWFVAGLGGSRGCPGTRLATALRSAAGAPPLRVFVRVADAYRAARAAAAAEDRIVVFGSCHTAGEVLEEEARSSVPVPVGDDCVRAGGGAG